MENINTSPKEVAILLDGVFKVLVEEGDQQTFQMLYNVVEEILDGAKERMNETLRLN